MPITLNEIREQLIQAIEYSGLKKTEIAQRLGIAQPTLSQYLSGRAMPALDTFANLCRILDLDANEILCLKNTKPNS
ncbi:MAG: helix-turn-helix transcriptional regulator [Clostridia bacterium]|nr:helix-turn-helix transcriptional regulator [Clostridia bacterium]